MEPRVVLVEGWPQPDTVTAAVLVVSGARLMLCNGTGEDEFAVLTFPWSTNLKRGNPNDESLSEHPLYRFGLRHCSFHRIENSPWLYDLERQNSVHPRHDSARFLRDKVHYLFALKEETVECIVTEREGTRVEIGVFKSRQSALEHMRNGIDA